MVTSFERQLNKRLSVIVEDENSINQASDDYDRQYAEDILYHTLSPLTDDPRWVNAPWSSKSPIPDGYKPGGPAYHWTPEDVIYAFAGNPAKLFQSSPDSPSYGRMGGSPMFRAAKKVARKFGKGNDQDFISDLYANGFIPLTKMMHKGFDEGRKPFISYVIRSVIGAMEAGPGAEQTSLDVTADDRAVGKIGLRAAIKSTDPEEIRKAANTVQGKYQTEKSFDKSPENPFGQYSALYHQTMMAYADALESGDENKIEAIQSRMHQLVDEIQDSNPVIRGAASGLGQAISNKDRKTAIGIASMDNRQNDEAGSLGDTMAGDDNEDNWLQPETIKYILDIAINNDLGSILGPDSKWQKLAAELGSTGDNVGGKFTVNELRYLIRSLGPVGSNYPGEGQIRSNTQIPRDAKGWWEPGDDPEIEPTPDGKRKWNSIWKRGGYQPMQPTAIAIEMTQEVDEFNKLGIPTARTIKEKAKTDSRTGKETVLREAVGKVAVFNTVKAAKIKLQIIAAIHKDDLGLDEDINNKIPHGLFTDKIDREIVVEHALHMANILNESLISEAEESISNKSEPGFIRKMIHNLQKPQRPANDNAIGTKTGSGITKAIKYQDKLSKWSKKFNEDDENLNNTNEYIPYQGNNVPNYKGYIIDRGYNGWEYRHPDYDPSPLETGGPSYDKRAGRASSSQEAMFRVDELVADEEFDKNQLNEVRETSNKQHQIRSIIGRPNIPEGAVMALEDAPKGWRGSIEAMKQYTDKFSTDVDSGKLNPYAIANSMKKKGAKPSYLDQKGTPKKKKVTENSDYKPIPPRVVETLNGFTITVRNEGSNAQFFIARKGDEVYTSKSLPYVKNMATRNKSKW